MNRLLTFRNIATLLLCNLFLASCNNEDDIGLLPAGEYPMTFSTSVEQQLARSSSSNSWDGGEEVTIQIGSMVKKYIATTNGKLTAANGVEPFYWQSQSETKTVQGWYPYSGTTPTSWVVKSNQNTGIGYQASDLLFAPPIQITFAGRESTPLKFYHQTAKVVINIVKAEAATNVGDIASVRIGGAQNFALSGNYAAPTGNATQGTWSNLSTYVANFIPKELTPTGTDLKSYAALVIPQNMKDKKFIAVTHNNGNTYYYTPTGTDGVLQGGKVHTYNITIKNGYLDVDAVTGGQWTNGGQQAITSWTSYTATDLKPGDYYYSDGTWSDSGLRRMYADGTGWGAGTVSPVGGKIVVGVVFWVGDPTEGNHYNGTNFTDFGDPALKTEKPQCTHGLVVALQDASNSMKWQNTGSAVGNGGNAFYQSITTNAGAGDALNKLRGYNNTQAIRAYNANDSNTDKVLPVQAIDNWAASNTAPTNSSGWYLPSAKELTLLCGRDVNNIWYNNSGGTGMRNIVNASLDKIGSPATSITSTEYWSSSEHTISSNAYAVNFNNGLVYSIFKNNDRRVRAVHAF
ncbi:fimbrillin family protein [Proteiniphilum sp. UBA5384]|uniref:fimbrillin family protein n=1 Tax=Proteiniphilum sp. UBA5384 TaxID=1947279 RepID=UPI0025F682AA|nr:fimbrillin family protein [Proteiniphilum sp. UBA5384]